MIIKHLFLTKKIIATLQYLIMNIYYVAEKMIILCVIGEI